MRFWILTLVLASLFIMSCNSSPNTEGVVVRNDIQDQSYNSFVIDSVIASKGRQSLKRSLSPGEEIALPYKNVRGFTITRAYEDFDRIYRVKCPREIPGRIVIKLIDVHTNRMQGGCKLIKKGIRQHGGYIKWE